MRPNTAATLAEMLRLNGYSTAQSDKSHDAPSWEWSPIGPFDRWPTGSGFEYFYGFIGGETSQFYPSLVEGTATVAPDRTPEQGYHLTEDLAQRTRRWLNLQRSLMPDKPFFLYFGPMPVANSSSRPARCGSGRCGQPCASARDIWGWTV